VDHPLTRFEWQRQAEASSLLHGWTASFLAAIPEAATLAERMLRETGTRFFDWIDTIVVEDSESARRDLRGAGFLPCGESPGLVDEILRHPGGLFPRVGLRAAKRPAVYLKVESVADFAAARPIECDVEIHGAPLARLRRGRIVDAPAGELWVIERHGVLGLEDTSFDPTHAIESLRVLEWFRKRRRYYDDARKGFAATRALIGSAIAEIGRDLACDRFFAAEREYWQRRNRAAQVQKARQDRLGLGWANHDYHTYRSSRARFADLLGVFSTLGFVARERFYAGLEAGWGARVLEHPTTGIVIFADVDLSPDELALDFARDPLPERAELGTVGLWCALHGDSMLEAGMHHLECQFDFDSLRDQLAAEHGIETMKPFSEFSYLRQAFTVGERWPVTEARVDRLLATGRISPDQAAAFRRDGAVGSHLENLERNEGFKGFNQKGVSEIIQATDPRRLSELAARSAAPQDRRQEPAGG
jgi:hypothetical protein